MPSGVPSQSYGRGIEETLPKPPLAARPSPVAARGERVAEGRVRGECQASGPFGPEKTTPNPYYLRTSVLIQKASAFDTARYV
jgi:hypothetical protein